MPMRERLALRIDTFDRMIEDALTLAQDEPRFDDQPGYYDIAWTFTCERQRLMEEWTNG